MKGYIVAIIIGLLGTFPGTWQKGSGCSSEEKLKIFKRRFNWNQKVNKSASRQDVTRHCQWEIIKMINSNKTYYQYEQKDKKKLRSIFYFTRSTNHFHKAKKSHR